MPFDSVFDQASYLSGSNLVQGCQRLTGGKERNQIIGSQLRHGQARFDG
jgi:hypothetical protein